MLTETSHNGAVADNFLEGFHGRPINLKNHRKAMFAEGVHHVQQGRMSVESFIRKMHESALRENMATGDLPYLLQDAQYKQLLGGFQEAPPVWRQWCALKVVADLRTNHLVKLDGAEGVNEPIRQAGPYPETTVTDSEKTISVGKYGAKFSHTLEAFINDDLGGLNSVPARFGKRCRRTEDVIATKLISTDAAKSAIFTSGNANQVTTGNGAATSNPTFSVAGLQDAFKVISRLTDSDGMPIVVDGVIVMYPAELEMVAKQIQTALQFEFTDMSGSTTKLVRTANFIAPMVRWVPNPYLRLSTVSESNAATGWFMMADPNVSRPAAMVAQLRGRQNPELFIRETNARRIGGGAGDPQFDGSFENDTTEYKVRQWFGGTGGIEPKSIVYSNGSGS